MAGRAAGEAERAHRDLDLGGDRRLRPFDAASMVRAAALVKSDTV